VSHYVIIDGVLQKSSPETSRWAKRLAKQTPTNAEEPRDTVALTEREQSDWEILEGLDEEAL
jgi:hypothetical protein